MADQDHNTMTPTDCGGLRKLTPEAERALKEAEARRRARQAGAPAAHVKEIGGRDGPDPVRYGDWEKGGILSDF